MDCFHICYLNSYYFTLALNVQALRLAAIWAKAINACL
jgi:hypothetical protein